MVWEERPTLPVLLGRWPAGDFGDPCPCPRKRKHRHRFLLPNKRPARPFLSKFDAPARPEIAALRTMSLALEELDAVYGAVSHEEAVAIANLGAQCYLAAKEQLYAAWQAEVAQGETEREALCRKEGAAEMLESLKVRLATGDAALARVATLQTSLEAELTRRVEEVVGVRMKEAELAKREEMLVLKGQMAELQGSTKMLAILEDAHSAMKGELEILREENCKFKEGATKSSHTIGKMGEATVYDMLSSYVAPMLADAEVFDMTKVKHAGDFHVHVMGKHGKLVRVLIDVKKYAKPVDNIEIQKLYGDVDGCEVDVGLMLSLDSSICTKSQFQLIKTKGNKLCMFLSFENIDDGIRREILCWAIRALVGIVATQDHSKQDTMITEIQHFLIDMKRMVDKLDVGVKSLRGVFDVLRELKDEMLSRISAYKMTCGIDVIDSTAVEPSEMTGNLCKGKNKHGDKCRAKRTPGKEFCARHALKGEDLITHVE